MGFKDVLSGINDYLNPTFRKKKIQKEAFKNILLIAHNIAKENPNALIDYVRLLGRKMQGEYMCRTLSYREHEGYKLVFKNERGWFGNFTPITPDGKNAGELEISVDDVKTVDLTKDIIIPWPWNNRRIVNALCHIGTGKSPAYDNDGDTSWRQDSNHQVKLYLPMGVAFVNGGNHSITSGIIQSEGFIKTAHVSDISPLFNYVYCDGLHFYKTADNVIIGDVYDLEFAAIFEVGRIMHKMGISA